MVRIGCLGAAKIAPMAVITPARALKTATVTAVAARDQARAQAFADKHGIARVLPDYAALVSDPDIDVIYNALPPSGHAEWTIKALNAGKHVLCEKPFAMNAAEVEAMIAAASASGKVLMEGFHYRHHALMTEVMAILEAGRLGKLVRAQAIFCTNIRKTPDELRWRGDLGGGALMDLGTYALHVLRTTLKDEPVVEAANARVVDGVDARLGASLRFGSVKAHLYCAMRRGPPSPRLRIDGTKASLRVFNFVGPQFGHRLWVGQGFFDFGKSFGGPSTYEAQLAHFLKVIGGAAEPLPTLADSLAQMRAIDAIYAAAGMR